MSYSGIVSCSLSPSLCVGCGLYGDTGDPTATAVVSWIVLGFLVMACQCVVSDCKFCKRQCVVVRGNAR